MLSLAVVVFLFVANEGARVLAEWRLGLLVKPFRLLVAPGPRPRRIAAATVPIVASYLALWGLAIYHHKTVGVPTGTTYEVIDTVAAGFDAHGKLQADDVIRTIDDRPVYHRKGGDWENTTAALVQEQMATGAKTVTVGVDRGGQRHTVAITPLLDDSLKPPIYRLGVSLQLMDQRVPGSVGDAFVLPFRLVQPMIFPETLPSDAELTGPVGIARALEREDDAGLRLRLLITQGIHFFVFLLLPWFLLRLVTASLPTNRQ